MDDLLTDFLTETSESLAELDVALVRLERQPNDSGTLSLIFRLVHTIKGTCGFIGLPRLERVAHAGENVLVKVRDKELEVTPDIVSIILAALDRIRLIIAALASDGKEPEGDDLPLIESLNRVAEGGAPPLAGEAPTAPAVQHDSPAAPTLAAPTLAAPTLAAPEPARAVPPLPSPAEPAAPADGGSAADAIAGQTIRVGVDILERLMTMVSELVLARNQLLQLARSKEGKSLEMGDFSVPLQRLSHITSDLQEGVMKTRMQPIGNAWNKMPRLVRDLARDLDKKIELQMYGAETELDRQVLELIKDPLTHMVRNSGDHGLETPAERRAAGKNETGRVILKAYHEGGHIIIEVGDDGRGLPVEKIKAKALANGLATEAELAVMSEAQIQRFIFRAGLSTASAVTAVSGRGVGMDVVKTNIEKIGGTIDLKSVEGRGSTFIVKIPLTLAIVSALIVEAGGERFAIPQISVVELVRDQSSEGGESVIEMIDGTPVLRLRNRLLPLVNLRELLQLDGPAEPGAADSRRSEEPPANQYMVIAQVGESMLGMIVDRVFDTEEIVVKPVAPILRHMTIFSGNTILGDGSVIMILDPNGIARATGIAGTGNAPPSQDPANAGEFIRSSERVAMLLFRAGGGGPLAVPLALVARLEDIPREKIETSSGEPVTQYRGSLMPLVPLSGMLDHERERHPVLVFNDLEGGGTGSRCMGLVVDEIVDVVEDNLNIQLAGARPGVLGTAVVAGNATDIIDTAYWLTQAHPDWFDRSSRGNAREQRILVVEDSDFFRQLLVPTLAAGGYKVQAVESARHALQLRDAGLRIDAIISDIEMPDMDGIEFVRAIREEGPWRNLPVIALSGRARSEDMEAARAAGFTDFVEKFQRDALLASLGQCLSESAHAARLSEFAS